MERSDLARFEGPALTIATAFTLAASLCFALATIWAGLMDLLTMKIRNGIIIFLFLVYAVLAPVAGVSLAEIGASAGFAALVLVSMFVFFSMGWIGGGDAKLAAVVALWLGPDHAVPYLVYTAIFGGLLTLGILQFRSIALPMQCLSIAWLTRLHAPESGVPYGVAIASAALYVFPTTPWMTVLT